MFDDRGFPPDALPGRISWFSRLVITVLTLGFGAFTTFAVVQAVQDRDLGLLLASAGCGILTAFTALKMTERFAIAPDGLHVWRPVGSFHAPVRRVENTTTPGAVRLLLEGRRFGYSVGLGTLDNEKEFRKALFEHVRHYDAPMDDGLDDFDDLYEDD